MCEVCSLTLSNDRAEFTRIVAWIDSVVARFGLTASTAHALHLCLEEAVLNVISYAFEPNTLHDVHIALWRDGEAIHAEVTDDGRPFNPLSHELPAAPMDLRSAQIGGLGIKLIRGFAAHVSYQRSGSMNRLLLSFRT
jgi:anti-sigma regulatory factor (Ser/Thr protein kinase)